MHLVEKPARTEGYASEASTRGQYSAGSSGNSSHTPRQWKVASPYAAKAVQPMRHHALMGPATPIPTIRSFLWASVGNTKPRTAKTHEASKSALSRVIPLAVAGHGSATLSPLPPVRHVTLPWKRDGFSHLAATQTDFFARSTLSLEATPSKSYPPSQILSVNRHSLPSARLA